MPAIKIKNVSYNYPQKNSPSLQNVNLEIGYGEFVGVVGSGGSGKTTLFRLLTGLIPHYFGGNLSGEVSVDGLDVMHHSIGELATRVGMVFQELDSLIFFQTEIDYKNEPEITGMSPQEIRQSINQIMVETGLTRLWYKSPKNLSEEQKTLIAISRVLTKKPRIILLDDPTANLNFESSKHVIDLAKALNKEGITVILGTEKIDLLAECATHIVILNDGQVEANGSAFEIFSDPMMLKKIGFIPPQISQVAQKLREGGFELEEDALTVKEMFKRAMKQLNV